MRAGSHRLTWGKQAAQDAAKEYLAGTPPIDDYASHLFPGPQLQLDHDCHARKRISRRIDAATNLSLESSEGYHLSNYGLGGHYTPHVDSRYFNQIANTLLQERGNRLATTLFFLSDFREGGATAFVELTIAVKPRAGDALFWFDVEPYQETDFPQDFSFWHQKRAPDIKTLLVGCPVLEGSKWIATKWIREKGNVVVNYDFHG
ncbi:hypothetical protein HPB48_023523 [Haemaphysalis longicornis]|uniref:Fe2OG dioxygenase domain-containing protein n=1 Tax=Haemaphysalis longicornis TaxID=44386 RepID=A0A9J6H859_HAELO|nr:hypothetical protein HPB48_023523 [Haemaphysalis longicornis]